MKVLVIESNEATREALYDLLLLEWPDMEILKAESGEQGLLLAQTQHPDLILLEGSLHTSRGINGVGIAQTLRKMPAIQAIPMIAMTSPVLSTNGVSVGLSATCDAWLLKPFSAERLFQVVSPFAKISA